MWGYPHLTILAILAMLCIVSAMAFIPDLRYSLLFGLLSAAAMMAGYGARQLARAGGVPAPTGVPPPGSSNGTDDPR
jgi:L-asparagine transporter-like permease